jgi:hypothetical protein
MLLVGAFGCGPAAIVSINAVPNRTPLSGPNDALLAEVLQRCVDTSGRIDYAMLKGDSALTNYLSDLAITKTDAFVSRSAQLAFWLNAHNAAMLDLLRLNRPARGAFDVNGIRSAHVVIVGGETFSIYEIEHGIIQGQFREPRAFFATYLGGTSSPKLLNAPYKEETLSAQLDHAVQNFIADSTKNRVGKRPPALYASELFKTHADELSQASGSLVAFLRAFASGAVAQFLSAHANPEIDFVPYDWKQ